MVKKTAYAVSNILEHLEYRMKLFDVKGIDKMIQPHTNVWLVYGMTSDVTDPFFL